MTTLVPRAYRDGALTALLTALMGVGLAFLLRFSIDLEHNSQIAVVTVFAVFGFVLGGFRAGLGCPTAPLSNGAAAAAVAYVPMTIARVIQRTHNGASVPIVGIVFAGLLAASLGTLGGVVSNTANRNRASKGM